MMHQKAQLSNFMKHPEPVRVALEKYLNMVAEYCPDYLGTLEKKKGGKKPFHTPPLKRNGKKFREEAEILIYKGRANHNAN